MAFQRAQWHSGLTYRQICENCKAEVLYTDHKLDFRPWYADGYVDCPRCGSHLRHNERYAIDAPKTTESSVFYAPEYRGASDATVAAFCSTCGNKFGVNDKFCARCGAKRK